MPFIESSQTAKSKLHFSDVKAPVLIGLLVLVVIALILIARNVYMVMAADDVVFSESQVEQVDPSKEPDDPNSEESNSAGSERANSAVVSEDSSGSNSGTSVVVYVSGAVQNPGVYTLSSGSRVQDALNAAGGFSEDAAKNALNLARPIQDGEQINICTASEIESGMVIPDSAVNGSEGGQAEVVSNGLVNINTASAAELETLPGIGEATAQKIIANRESEGPFATKEDLMRVSGVGEKKFAALVDLIGV